MISDAFAAVLEKHRDRLNGRFAFARRQHRGLEGADFRLHLETNVNPVLDRLASEDADAVEPVALALYDLSLDLVGRELVGPKARFPAINELWAELFPFASTFIAERPWDLPAALTNAVYNLAVEPTAEVEAWHDDMLFFVNGCTSADELLAVGQVVAWRCGMAHYRKSAIEVARAMRPGLRQVLLETDKPEALEHRWTKQGITPTKLQIVRRVGGFGGFGGAFQSPPNVKQVDGKLYAWDTERCYAIHADVFGATLKRCGSLPGGEAARVTTKWSVGDRLVQCDERQLKSTDVQQVTGWAATDDTLAIAVAHSHEVLLVAVS